MAPEPKADPPKNWSQPAKIPTPTDSKPCPVGSAAVCSRCRAAGGVESLQHALVVLFCVHQPLYGDAAAVWTVGDQVAVETTNGPEADLGDFAWRSLWGAPKPGFSANLA
jgi:hypothetical protein